MRLGAASEVSSSAFYSTVGYGAESKNHVVTKSTDSVVARGLRFTIATHT